MTNPYGMSDPHGQPGSATPAGGYGQPYGQQGGYGQPVPAAYPVPPENHLVWAAFAMTLCCAPLGVVAIVKAAQVNMLWGMGQHEAAYQAAQDAKKYAKWAAIIGGGVIALVALVYVGIFAFAISAARHFT